MLRRIKTATAVTLSAIALVSAVGCQNSPSEPQTVTYSKEIAQRLDNYTPPIIEIKQTSVETVVEVVPAVRYYSVPLSEDLQDYIFDLCDEYCVDEALVLALIDHESGFNPNAISTTNDYGLMQINGINYQSISNIIGEWAMLDPYDNVHAGILLLSDCINETDSLHTALVRYNQGKQGAESLFKQGIYSTKYSKTIMGKYYEIKKSA